MARTNITDVPGLPESLSANGYSKLPGGLILQWGKLTNVALNQTFHPITFPIPFPNSTLNVSVTIGDTAFVSDNIAPWLKTDSITNTGFSAGGDYGTTTTTGDLYWFAIGY